jgi:hypothetical protein
MKSGVIIAVLGGAAIATLIGVVAYTGAKANKRKVVRATTDNDAWRALVDHMTDEEIAVLYDLLTKYGGNPGLVPQGSQLSAKVLTVLSKYNLNA